MIIALIFDIYYSNTSDINKWFVSPYLTLSKETRVFFFFFLEKSLNDKKMVMIMKRCFIKKKKLSNGMEYKMSWSITKPTKSCIQQRLQ